MKPIPRKLILLIATFTVAVTIASVAIYWQPLIAWYEFQLDFETLPVNAQGLPEYKHRKTGIIFVKVPGGTFMMGSPEDEEWRLMTEGPQKKVEVPSFLIAKYEVSQKQWIQVMGVNPSHFKGDDLPVESVSWMECLNFCKRSNVELPSEIQCEYACRAGTESLFNFGNEINTASANYNGQYPLKFKSPHYRDKTVSIDSFDPNLWGLHNVHGNVWEWCESDLNYFNMKVVGEDDDFTRVRGGSWGNKSTDLRSARRSSMKKTQRRFTVGFRPVRNLE